MITEHTRKAVTRLQKTWEETQIPYQLSYGIS